ncbi:MBL fold metallo-hydrolase [Devosia sp. 919]|uniref:MBL fold metallo-hydrolase n=1 Tax=Devosia sp. 919 TaxID=2726065 RepID=UPI001552BA5B|nr:MBL fold metallo-hydrolase [Devosia sp. 919]
MPSDLFSSTSDTGLQASIQGLYATPAAPLPFLDGVVVRSFVLQREQGNVVIYNSPGINAAAQEILDMGRPDRLLVNHWHEAMYGAPDLDIPIFVHEDDHAKTKLPIAGTFPGQQGIADAIEVIPTPGHTAGTTMFLWDNGEHRLLFPGDMIWVQGGEWKAVLLGESDRDAYLASLSRIMDLKFDILVPWGSEEGQPYGYGVTPTEVRENLGRIIDRLRNGEDA